MAKFLVLEYTHPQDLKGGTTTGTSTPAQGLIGVIHAARKQMETMKTPPRVLVVNSASDTKLEGPVHGNSR